VFIDSIGSTPLIKLKAASEATGCVIYGKAEFLHPGVSVKDRAALAIIEDAEKQGKLKPGGVIVEGTAGNTGIGLAMVCASTNALVAGPSRSEAEVRQSLAALIRNLTGRIAVPCFASNVTRIVAIVLAAVAAWHAAIAIKAAYAQVTALA